MPAPLRSTALVSKLTASPSCAVVPGVAAKFSNVKRVVGLGRLTKCSTYSAATLSTTKSTQTMMIRILHTDVRPPAALPAAAVVSILTSAGSTVFILTRGRRLGCRRVGLGAWLVACLPCTGLLGW